MSDLPLIELRSAGLGFRKETHRRSLFPRAEKFWALRELSLELREHERLAVIGTNGSGKTTLMRLLAGVYEPDEGLIIRRVRPTLLSLGTGFNQQLTGRQNIYLNGALLGIKRADIKRSERQIEEFADIGDFIDSPLRTYSSGMRLRLGFAIASHLKPDVLLLDETLASGDRFFRERAAARMHTMASECRALVLVSHSEGALTNLCSRAIWLDRGRIRAMGEVEDVLRNYRGKDKSGTTLAADDVAGD